MLAEAPILFSACERVKQPQGSFRWTRRNLEFALSLAVGVDVVLNVPLTAVLVLRGAV